MGINVTNLKFKLPKFWVSKTIHIKPTPPHQRHKNTMTKIGSLIFTFIFMPLKSLSIIPLILGRNEFR